MKFFALDPFIANHITNRKESLFQQDLMDNQAELASRIGGKAALVIGGAGTIGSSFIKALLRFRPKKLYVVDTNENGLAELTRDLRSSIGYNVPEDYKTYPINFGSSIFEKILNREGPFEIVANFAAHKHVRSEKDHYSIEAMVQNNVVRAGRLLGLLLDYPPERFFCVSTDKAANPVNVMGASKKLMEEVILAYSRDFPITTARFANVAFSNGSLLDGFLHRLMKKQPLSSPSDVRRYFVSPQESGEICLLACMLGEPGNIFFPKLEENQMRKFSDIGAALLQTLGYEADYCGSEQEAREKASMLTEHSKKYPVYFYPTDTSGEKLYEEFFTDEEEIDWQRFQKLGIIKGYPRLNRQEIALVSEKLEQIFQKSQVLKREVVALLEEFVPTFQHLEMGKHLDQRM